MAAERQIPGGPFLNETATAQRQIPGAQYVNETVAAGSVTVTAGLGALTVAGLAPALAQTWSAAAGAGALSIAGLAPTLQAISYDYMHAAADVTDGQWLRSDNGTNVDLYQMIDEDVIDDADYIYTNTLDDECEIALEVGSSPSISGHMHLQIKVPSGFTPIGKLTVTLMDGAAQVQQWASQSVTAGQLLELAVTESVAAYNDLRVRLKSVA